MVISQGPNEKSIIMQTKIGRDIPNSQSHEISAFERNQYSRIDKDFHYIKFRTNPNPIYNCHGLIFASRRTGISDNEALHHILDDDGYAEIEEGDVIPGDTILYFSTDGDIEHSGVVVSKPDKQLRIPDVLSKWGKYKEVIHAANNCPYTFNVKYYRVK